MADDFCIEHGYEFMKSEMGNPIPYCTACDLHAQKLRAAKIEPKNMTATEVDESIRNARIDIGRLFEPMINEMLRIAQKQGSGTDPGKAMLIDDESKLSIVDITIDADHTTDPLPQS